MLMGTQVLHEVSAGKDYNWHNTIMCNITKIWSIYNINDTKYQMAIYSSGTLAEGL